MTNSAYEQRKQALIDEITAAFDGVSREGGVSLHEAQAMDGCTFYESAEVGIQARLKDTETRWQDVPDEDIVYGYSCLSSLGKTEFRYYIPAYMVWFLQNLDNEDMESPAWGSNTFESLIEGLTVEGWIGGEDFYRSRFKIFTSEQSKAIAHFLEFVVVQGEKQHLEINGVWEERFQEEVEFWLQKTLSEIGLTQGLIDARKHEFKQLRREHILAKFRVTDSATQAFKRYWGQFL